MCCYNLCYRNLCYSVSGNRDYHSVTDITQCPFSTDIQVLCCLCVSFRYQVMAKVKKTNAQKQREYRARRDSDPQRRAEYLEKERASWARKTAEKKWQPMSSLSEREKRVRRRKNRDSQARFRHRQSVLASAAACTPPSTPSASVQDPGTSSVRESR